MKQFLVFSFVISALVSNVEAQQRQYSASVITESMALPLTRLTPIHPGLEFGYSWQEQPSFLSVNSINLHAGYYFHRKVQNAFYLRVELAWSININRHIATNLYSGLGYMHVFYPGDVYELNSSSGDFEKIKQRGRPHALGLIGWGFTYKNSTKVEPFIRQDIGLESPFANGIPVMIHSFTKIGTNFKLD